MSRKACFALLLCALAAYVNSPVSAHTAALKRVVSRHGPGSGQGLIGPSPTQSGSIVTASSLNGEAAALTSGSGSTTFSASGGSLAAVAGESGSGLSPQTSLGASVSGSGSGSGSHSSNMSSHESSESSHNSTHESSSSSSSHACTPPTMCTFPIKNEEHIDKDLKKHVPPPDPKDKKEEEPAPGKQGEYKHSLVEVDAQDTIEATAVVAMEHPSLADQKEEIKRLLPDDNKFTLKTDNEGKDYDIGFDKQMGLAPTMSVSSVLIKRGYRLLPIADKRHYVFEERHEMDCMGSICPQEEPEKV